MDRINEILIDRAKKASISNFCCKDSKFSVGTALLTKSGKIFKGFNIENDGLQSICGERTAFVKALSEGESEFVKIAIVGKNIDSDNFIKTVPCGYCRQFMMQYGGKDLEIILFDDVQNKEYVYKLSELLPESFEWSE